MVTVMPQKNYTQHTAQDLDWIAGQMEDLVKRLRLISSRMEDLECERINLLDRATLDSSLKRVADWINKATTAMDLFEVSMRSPHMHVSEGYEIFEACSAEDIETMLSELEALVDRANADGNEPLAGAFELIWMQWQRKFGNRKDAPTKTTEMKAAKNKTAKKKAPTKKKQS